VSQPKSGSPESVVMLRGVRLAFPDLYVARQFDGKGPFSYKATFLIIPGSDNDKAVKAAITNACATKWGAKATALASQLQAQGSQKYCYLSGDLKDYDGFAGMMALATSRSQDAGAPKVIDRDPTVELTAADGRPYGGCYVNAKISIYAQDNKFGHGVRATLMTVQFAKDGDSFGGAPPANAEGFETVEDDGGDLS
jgi:hypothetical protein